MVCGVAAPPRRFATAVVVSLTVSTPPEVAVRAVAPAPIEPTPATPMVKWLLLTVRALVHEGLAMPRLKLPCAPLVGLLTTTPSKLAVFRAVVLMFNVPPPTKVTIAAVPAKPPWMFKVEPVSTPITEVAACVIAEVIELVVLLTARRVPVVLRPEPVMLSVVLFNAWPAVAPFNSKAAPAEMVRVLAGLFRFWLAAMRRAPVATVQVPVRPELFTPALKASVPSSSFCNALVAALVVKAVSSVAIVPAVTKMPLDAPFSRIWRPVSV